MDPALLRNIALQVNDKGRADAQVALVAHRLIDKNGGIQLDPDDLPGTMGRLVAEIGQVPAWKKFSVTLDQIKAAPVEDGMAKILLLTTAGITIIHNAIIKPAAGFLGEVVDEVPTEVVVKIYVGHTGNIESIMGEQVGYGDGLGIENDPGFVQASETQASAASTHVIFFAEPTEINLHVELAVDPGPPVEADFDALTSGAVDLWLLLSQLPA